MTENNEHNDVPADVGEHFCVPCDVDTMARRLNNLDKRRVQQIAKDDPDCKNERGEYICPRMVGKYIATIKDSKRKNASGLVKKQEESLDIRNARDRAEVLAEWEVMVQRQAIHEELAPLFLTVRNNVRQIPGALQQDIVRFVREAAEKIANGEQVMDYEIALKWQRLASAKIADSLSVLSSGVAEWAEKSEEKVESERRVPWKIGKFWGWVKKRFA